jgi:hypothetical protein
LCEVSKDPVTSGNAEAGVFAYVQAYAARSGRMPGSVDEAWTGSWGIVAGKALKGRGPWTGRRSLDLATSGDYLN